MNEMQEELSRYILIQSRDSASILDCVRSRTDSIIRIISTSDIPISKLFIELRSRSTTTIGWKAKGGVIIEVFQGVDEDDSAMTLTPKDLGLEVDLQYYPERIQKMSLSLLRAVGLHNKSNIIIPR